MDVKAVNSVQASLEMNSQNIKNSQVSGEHISIENNRNAELQDQSNDWFHKLDSKEQNDIIKKSIEEINKKFDMLDSHLKIQMDRDTNMKVVKIIDNQTKKVIRQIPPEAVLKIAKYIDEVTGLIFNKKV